MKNIEELVQNVKKYKKAVIQDKLKSKKNTVAYVTIKDKPRVLKWFVPGLKRQMKIEYNVLKKGSSKLNMPYLFNDFVKEFIVLILFLLFFYCIF